MLVDNAVKGDSRVQKQARSAAERGWDVILLGRAPGSAGESWQIGSARVQLLPVPTPLARPRQEYRRAPLRSPLAYPAGPVLGYARQRVRARQADLFNRRARLQADALEGTASGPSVPWGEARLFVARVAARVHREWVNLRVRRSQALMRRRRAMTSPVDRASTRWWKSTMGVRAWRRLEPGLWDFELAYGPRIDRLKPDLIHANDFRMIGVGAQATARSRAAGRTTKLVWDAHEFLPGVYTQARHPRWHDGYLAYEREFVPYADAVVTVSETMADLLVDRYRLKERPAIVLNAPTSGLDGGDREAPTIRDLCDIGPEVPLLVYSGAAGVQRGLNTLIEGQAALPGVHLALVTGSVNRYVRSLLDRASELDVLDRLHVLPYVAVDDICRFLSTADVGVHPTLHYGNHEVDLPTKFYEYSQAGLPLVVSDVKTLAAEVRATRQGEVFRAGETADYVVAVNRVLAEPSSYRAAYDVPGRLQGWLWEPQAEALDRVYSRLIPSASNR